MQGFFRYWTPNVKNLLGELSQAESEKESSLKNILQRLIGQFCEHHVKWRQLVSITAGWKSSSLFIDQGSCIYVLIFLPDWRDVIVIFNISIMFKVPNSIFLLR